MQKTHIIIGASAAGIGVLNQLRTLDPESNIICIAKDVAWPYNTCFLADYLSGIKEHDQLLLKPKDFFEKQRIQLMLGREVKAINRAQRIITLDDAQTLAYDTLFLGLGARARTLLIPGAENCKEIFYFHTYEDVLNIKQCIDQKTIKHALVIGAGLSGLEVADSLIKNGIHVTIVEQSLQVLQHHADAQGSQKIKELALSHNASIMTNDSVERVVNENGALRMALLASGKTIAADMLIITIGSLPNSALARDAGLALMNDAVVVNEYMQTSDPCIFAGGDVAWVRERLSGQYVRNGTWPDAMHQGLIAAHSMVAILKAYPGVVNIISSAFFGTHFFSCGPVLQPFAYECIVREGVDYYHKFLLDNGVLKGFLLIGHTQKAAEYRRLFLSQAPIEKI